MPAYHPFPIEHYRHLLERDGTVLLETSRFDAENYRSYLFTDPLAVLKISSPDELPALMRAIDKERSRGHFVAGYLAYECGFHFEEIAPRPVQSHTPLALFGVYRRPSIFDHRSGTCLPALAEPPAGGEPSGEATDDYRLSDVALAITPGDYAERIARIKEYIREGETYQINFTTAFRFRFEGSALAFYEALKKKQHVAYGAFMRLGGRTVASLSPELFFRRAGNTITVKPMKGTARRGRTGAEDTEIATWLRNDTKNRAENVMIVDLLRNDLGRIAAPGSVSVPELFTVERYDTLFQMTSTVRAALKSELPAYDLFRSIFPCGSVTGAPKIRSMQIIHELEGRERGIYTGAIGFMSPGGDSVFNVAIRTIVIDGTDGEMGVGGGIVADSVAGDEFNECLLKGQFLTTRHEEFSLIETLLWDGKGYPFLEKHLARIEDSAGFFDYSCDTGLLRRQLGAAAAASFTAGRRYKVRLTLDRTGAATITHRELPVETGGDRPLVAFAGTRTSPADTFLYHKTTRRRLYNDAASLAAESGCADFIFMNERGEVTEGATSNILIRRGDILITPPLSCGLLNGIYRQHLLEETTPAIREEPLTRQDVEQADAVYVCNAVRGVREVRLAAATTVSLEHEYVPARGSRK